MASSANHRTIEEIEHDLSKLYTEIFHASRLAMADCDGATADRLFAASLDVNSALCEFIRILRPQNVAAQSQDAEAAA